MDIKDSSHRIHEEEEIIHKYSAKSMQNLAKDAGQADHITKYLNEIFSKIEKSAKLGNIALYVRVPKKYTKRIIRELKNKYNYYVDGRGESNPFSEFLSFLTNTTVLDIRWDSY